MKYIIIETPEGAHLPIIFPDMLTHVFVAGAMQLVIDTLDPKKYLRPSQLDRLAKEGSGKIVSAGFVELGLDVSVHGSSESLGDLPSRPIDAARIVLGDTIQFMPDAIAQMVMDKLKEIKE